LQPPKKTLSILKKSIYELNKTAKAPRGIANSSAELTVATWVQPAVTESAERLDISPLLNITINCRGKSRLFALGGMDYGLETMGESIGISIEKI
ncbi:hypothetical protein BGX27_001604, partial [Mortierella sp. AM989]